MREGGANYFLTLKKAVTQPEHVRDAEAILLNALSRIVKSWILSGGTYLSLQTEQRIVSPNFKSNADVVEGQLWEDQGKRRIITDVPVAMEFMGTYRQPPLAWAVQIAELMRDDFLVCRIIDYYQRANLSRNTFEWCLHLYKVRDLLKKFYRNNKNAIAKLGISNNQWDRFGRLLNSNNMRHADIDGVPPILSSQDIEFLFGAAQLWIAKFIRIKGVNAIG